VGPNKHDGKSGLMPIDLPGMGWRKNPVGQGHETIYPQSEGEIFNGKVTEELMNSGSLMF